LAQDEILGLKPRSPGVPRPDTKQQLDQKRDHRPPPLPYGHARVIPDKVFGRHRHFAQIRIPSQSLSLDFDNSKSFQPHHYAFKVGEAEFDDIFGRVKEEGLAYGSGPFTPDDMKINNWNGGRGVYFRDPSGHLLELLTKDYSAETMPK
jgi:catechol 2,3-dioxygenase-like lactoylglutathione lyase family enzyme